MQRKPLLIIVLLFLGACHANALLAGTNCVPDATTLCLSNDRFSVTVNWANFAANGFSLLPATAAGSGNGVELSDDSGYFWFDNARGQRNAEILVKVLDGCSINGRFWVFAAATTNVEFTITVTDTQTAQSRAYSNAPGNPFPTVTDTAAFQTCPTTALSTATASISQAPARDATATTAPRISPSADKGPAPSSPCATTTTALCLNSNRFLVEVDWEDFNGITGRGTAVPVMNSTESGLFWFFSPDNIEMLVKVLDGRAFNDHFWVFAGATTNVEYTLRVTDTQTGETRTYVNPLGSSSTFLDNQALGGPQQPVIVPTLSGWSVVVLGLVLMLAAATRLTPVGRDPTK